jgi:hypothetical protein
MQILKVDLEHCYGIKKLRHDFDFTKTGAIALYAPNGAMKSSFAQTFKDIASAQPSKDRVFTNRVTKREIIDETGTELPKNDVFVIEPYDETYKHTERSSALLVDSTLRKEYDDLLKQIETATDALLKNLKKQSGLKREELEATISKTFMKTDDAFLEALDRVRNEVTKLPEIPPYADVRYDIVFEEPVISFLATADFKTAIKEYIEKYDDLLAASTYFKKGIFNYYNASTIAKSLSDNGFFNAKHSVNLNAGQAKEIKTRKELEAVIEEEKNKITDDSVLKKKFQNIEDKLNKNLSLRQFHTYLVDNRGILPNLANIDLFREDVWKSYFKANFVLYCDVLDKYHAFEEKLVEIRTAAADQRTQWETVVGIFNHRFHVPFKLNIKNREAVILGQEPIPILGFSYIDGEEKVQLERPELLRILSMGEKKAFYVLNIIFEMEARKHSKQETLFIVDDIADSFDYKNKYAIIEYLRDVSEEACFKQIILTHNFDFYRTICTRFVGYGNCLMTSKTDTELKIEPARGVKNPFVKDWKVNYSKDAKKKIACIPFMRNLVEFTKGESDSKYVQLTSLLHFKPDTLKINQSDLDIIFNELFDAKETSADPQKPVMQVLGECIQECLDAADGINFENKVVLSIGIRIAAEQFMVAKISDDAFVASLDENPTPRLFKKYREKFPADTPTIEVLHSVVLMTPECLHLNAFMYEPIMDMSDGHLRSLFVQVSSLK